MYTCQTVIDRKIEAPTSREGMHKYFPYFFILYFYTTFESIGLGYQVHPVIQNLEPVMSPN